MEEPEDLSDCEPETRLEVTAVLFFLQKACPLLYSYAGRDEVRKLTCESASAVEKKNDAAHATAKFVFLV